MAQDREKDEVDNVRCDGGGLKGGGKGKCTKNREQEVEKQVRVFELVDSKSREVCRITNETEKTRNKVSDTKLDA